MNHIVATLKKGEIARTGIAYDSEVSSIKLWHDIENTMQPSLIFLPLFHIDLGGIAKACLQEI